jgi:hypothetical protein
MRRIRKRFRVFFLAAVVATIIVPVGFALSLRSAPLASPALMGGSPGAHSAALPAAAAVPATLVPAVDEGRGSFEDPLPDAARLFLAGAVLVGLAAVLRKAV